jgi:glycosyltransferase involved in cell wall biosynthesis
MLRNKKIDHIYVLNDPDSAQYLNSRYHKTNLFVALADPVLIPPGFDHHDSYVKQESSSRYRFLLFGSLSSRKGIFDVIDALHCIPETVAKQIEVIFAGKVVDEDKVHFRSRIVDLHRDRPKIKITVHDEFVPFEKIPALFFGIDCILLPYNLVSASSGLIGLSALYGKPVIGPARGLIGKLIRSYRLGLEIEPVNAPNIAAAIMDLVKKGPPKIDNISMQRFVEERNPNKFVETLLEGEL